MKPVNVRTRVVALSRVGQMALVAVLRQDFWVASCRYGWDR